VRGALRIQGRIEYDPDLDQFRGEIMGINGSAYFYGKSPASLRKKFKISLKVFLEVCEEKGLGPLKEYSGKFNPRIPPRLHGAIAAKAIAEDNSINQ
jgi:predicted HicB family RNase H-like nuclease